MPVYNPREILEYAKSKRVTTDDLISRFGYNQVEVETGLLILSYLGLITLEEGRVPSYRITALGSESLAKVQEHIELPSLTKEDLEIFTKILTKAPNPAALLNLPVEEVLRPILEAEGIYFENLRLVKE